MKTIKFFLVLLVFPFMIQAQNLVEENKIWNIASIDFFGGGTTTTHSLKLEGDTTINSFVYKKVWRSNDSLNVEWTAQNQFLREDTDNRVFRYASNGDELLYDFSMVIGDTMNIDNNCKLVLQDIDEVMLDNGELRSRYILEGISTVENLPVYWIRGIGSIQGGLLGYQLMFCAFDYPDRFLCHSENGEVLYRNESFSSCYENTVSTAELKSAIKIEVFPNPVEGDLYIRTEQTSNLRYDLLDVLGNIKISKTVVDNQVPINLEGLERGIYFITFYDSNKRLFSKKIILR